LRSGGLKAEGGFTLIELLVVILIVGILAGIAIPTFIGQRNKAYSAQAEELARSIALAMEAYATQNNGVYEGATLPSLSQLEPTIPPTGRREGLAATVLAQPAGYQVAVELTNLSFGGRHPRFEIRREPTGATAYLCTPAAPPVGCPPTGSW